jgi:hypothetical protein
MDFLKQAVLRRGFSYLTNDSFSNRAVMSSSHVYGIL